MITGMTVLDILIVSAIFLPFIWLARIGKKPKRKLYKQFMDIAQKNGLHITEKEFWANAYIGIDCEKKELLFIRSEDGSLDKKLIDLSKVKECKVITSVENIRTKNTNQRILKKVDLQIYFTGKDTTMELLNFYDSNRIYSEDFEVKRAEEWKKTINENRVHAMITAMAS